MRHLRLEALQVLGRDPRLEELSRESRHDRLAELADDEGLGALAPRADRRRPLHLEEREGVVLALDREDASFFRPHDEAVSLGHEAAAELYPKKLTGNHLDGCYVPFTFQDSIHYNSRVFEQGIRRKRKTLRTILRFFCKKLT